MSIFDRYLGGIILQYTLITMLALLGLFTFVDFLDQLGDLGKGGYGPAQAVWYIILTIPRTLYELFPMAALLGAIIGLSLLANDSELTVMRAGGVSVLQITASAMKVGGVFVIAAVLVGELVAPQTEALAQRNRAEALQKNIGRQTDSGLWMRDAHAFINAAEVLPDLTLLGIRIFEFGPDKKLRALVSASDGAFENGTWRIRNVRQTRIDAAGNIETAQLESSEWRSTVTPQLLAVFLTRPEQLSLWRLHRYIRHLEANRQHTGLYQLAFWNKLMLPVATAVMVALAIPFVFVNIRSGNLGRSLFIGIMLGLGFYAANKAFGYLVLAYHLPPPLGATLPLAAFLALAAGMMRRVE